MFYKYYTDYLIIDNDSLYIPIIRLVIFISTIFLQRKVVGNSVTNRIFSNYPFYNKFYFGFL
ncbi:MAG: hypothetical protein C0595_11840 [Marinilabiliales bacterium]|nr:MAG: hypothetical protein C0595_11840 [Marinilabiliales bacterium]